MHDHSAGISTVCNAPDPIVMIQAARGRGITVRAFAEAFFEKTNPTLNELEKARRKLQALEKKGAIVLVEVPAATGGNPLKAYHTVPVAGAPRGTHAGAHT